MPLFGRRSKDEEARRPSPERPPNDPDGLREAASALSELFEARLMDADGRIRVEDLLSAAAAVCGEACIAAAGEIDPQHHALEPGSAVLSDRVNAILVADAPNWGGAATSVFGIVRGGALAQGYARGRLPADRRADPALRRGARRGRGAVGLRAAERARGPPAVRAAACARPTSCGRRLERCSPSSGCPPRSGRRRAPSRSSSSSARVRDAIDHGVATRLVLETVNGMAKTAPMTDEHMREPAA